jgi:hypothetical protein
MRGRAMRSDDDPSAAEMLYLGEVPRITAAKLADVMVIDDHAAVFIFTARRRDPGGEGLIEAVVLELEFPIASVVPAVDLTVERLGASNLVRIAGAKLKGVFSEALRRLVMH